MQHKERLAKMDYDLKLMEFSSKEGIKLSELKVQLALNAGSKEKATVPQVSKPPVEPTGTAAPGHAYEQ